MGTRQVTSGPLAALLLGAGAVGGFLAGTLLVDGEGSTAREQPFESRSPNPATPAAAARSEELAQVLAELRRSVDAFSAAVERLGARPAAGSSTQRVAQTAPETAAPLADGDELAAAIRALAAEVRALRPPGSVAAGELEIPRFVDRASAFAVPGLRQAMRGNDDALRDQALSRLRTEHMFWSYQEVLKAYGRPDYIWGEGDSMTWNYDLALPDGGAEAFTFTFHQGMVTEVGYDYDGG